MSATPVTSATHQRHGIKPIKLSVVMPVYNEAATVKAILTKVLTAPSVSEVVVVDDGSTDTTLKLIKEFKHQKLKVFSKPNGGKGSAVRFGLKHVTGTHVLIQDADLEYDPSDIPMLLEQIEKGRVEVVYGSRFLGSHSNLLFWHRLGNDMLNMVVNILYNTTLSDMETCYKVVPTKLLKDLNLESNGFELEPEITCKILRRGINIFEVPINYVGRDFSEGKKITWRDGFSALWMILKQRF
ncbi:MAG TPA: glycosyl transferase [Candidatus Pacebacteria bacterium]|nr:glycosyl transferase [Candidatus Paceibacterota bacterium]